MRHSCTNFTSIWIFSTLISVLISSCTSENVLGAGGFIRSKKNIDFSRIQIELHSQTPGGGRRKVDSTDAAPNNGYYFIPVEETGAYILKPVAPRGWKIEPEERQINIDGKNDNEEFDFEFIGFGITGAVYSRSQSFGPGGITVELVSPDAGATNVLQVSKTDEKGQYVFFGVLPGRYFLRIGQEDKSKYDFDTIQHEVDVGEDVGNSKPFQIQGYRIKGSISATNGDGLSGVKFLLTSPDGNTIQSSKSDTTGYFTFSNVDNGDYLVKLDSSEKGQTSLDLDKSERQIKVEHDHQTVTSFIVKSFALDAEIVASKKTQKPLAGVKVKVLFGDSAKDSETVTDQSGKFILNGVQSGHSLKLRAVLDGYDFEGVDLSSLTPRSVSKFT